MRGLVVTATHGRGDRIGLTAFFRLPTLGLAAVCVVSAFFTMDVALGWDVFGLFHKQQFNLTGGWILNGQHMYTGFVRLIYPYVCGLLIARLLSGRITPENISGSPILFTSSIILWL